MTDHLPAVRRLRDENKWGSVKIGRELGIGRDSALRLMNKLKLEDARGSLQILGDVGTPTGLYDTACRALAAAVRVDEVKSVLDVTAAMREYTRQAKDTEMEANVVVLRERAERRLGEMILEGKKAGQISRGQPPKKNSAKSEEFSRIRLDEVNIDHKLSARAQKKASISAKAYDSMLAKMREEIVNGRRVHDILKVHPINGARSVMGSRVEPDDSLDFFPTPPFATRALCEIVLPHLGMVWDDTPWCAWEPGCGEGHMSEVLKEYFREVWATDIHQYAADVIVHDFIAEQTCSIPDWIITNPPFGGNTIPFILRAIELARVGVAMFLRLQILETIERYEKIFKPHPPTLIAFFAERVNLCKGRWDPDGGTATAYCWLVWMKDRAPMAPFWIPPGQREALTKPDDRARFAAWSMPHDPETGEVTPSTNAQEAAE